jgi:anaphase-promoting complex subunit 8
MVRCFGRILYTYKMPNKPIKQGYKIFALAEHGYIWTFSWSSRQLGIEEMFKWPGLTPTGSMVVEFVTAGLGSNARTKRIAAALTI